MKKSLIKFLVMTCCLFSIVAQAEEIIPSIPPQRTISTLEKIKEVDQVLFLMQKRLAIIHELARWKWNTKTEVEDTVLEKQVLKKIGRLAVAYGLNKEWTLKFFRAQLDAEKTIQLHDFEYWTEINQVEFEEVADQHTEIRPYLDRLNKELLQALVDTAPFLHDEEMLSMIPQQPLSSRPGDLIDEDVWQKAIEPLYFFSP